MGHVPAGALRVLRAGGDLQGRQRGGASGEGALAIDPATERARRLGAVGEAAAAEWYLARGYEVLARNWRCREGEIDLVLRRGATMVFCEVKTRRTGAFGTAAESVTFQKQARVRRLATRFLSGWSGPRPRIIRFDVAAIDGGAVTVVEAAF